jgi:hypothetical protein
LPTCNDPVGLGAKRTLFTCARLAPRRPSVTDADPERVVVPERS